MFILYDSKLSFIRYTFHSLLLASEIYKTYKTYIYFSLLSLVERKDTNKGGGEAGSRESPIRTSS